MTKYYDKWRKGMKKGKGGKYYYPKKRKQVNTGRKNFSRIRAPLVECKKLTHGIGLNRIAYATPLTWIPNRSFLEYQRGFKNADVLGSDIFSKYYSMKIRVNFPRDAYSIPEDYRLYLVHGVITKPFGLPKIPADPYQYERDTVNFADLEKIMIQLVGAEFDSQFDEMEFRTKEKKFYKILGKQLIKPSRNNQIGLTQQTSLVVDGSTVDEIISGGPPPVFKQLKWDIMKKVRLTETAGQTAEGSGGFLFPNESQIPFAFFYSPDHLNLKHPEDDPLQTPVQAAMISYQYNDCHWFTDS